MLCSYLIAVCYDESKSIPMPIPAVIFFQYQYLKSRVFNTNTNTLASSIFNTNANTVPIPQYLVLVLLLSDLYSYLQINLQIVYSNSNPLRKLMVDKCFQKYL